MKRLNKKGFTLVELLAVIVILALIMGITIVSISSVISNSRNSAFTESAVGIIHGVKQNLAILGRDGDDGVYYVGEGILQSGGGESPFGGNYNFATSADGTAVDNLAIYKASGDVSCTASAKAFVKISGGAYSICLTTVKDGNPGKYIDGTEREVISSSNAQTIKNPS